MTMNGKPEYMNGNSKCIACMKGREKVDGSILVNGKVNRIKAPLIKHHVRYDPEVIAYVHFKCHQIIHDPEDSRYKHLIQYQVEESKEYYENKG